MGGGGDDLTEGFLCYRFGGLIFGGAYTWRGLFSEFYGNLTCSHNAAKSLGVLSSCPVVRARSGKVRSTPQLTVQSRFDRAEKALGLGCARVISSRFIMFSALSDSAQANHPAIEV